MKFQLKKLCFYISQANNTKYWRQYWQQKTKLWKLKNI